MIWYTFKVGTYNNSGNNCNKMYPCTKGKNAENNNNDEDNEQ